MITAEDRALAAWCLDRIKAEGADSARYTLNRSVEDLVATLNGQTDRITHCEDCSISLEIFAKGRFGSFSTNRCDRESLAAFIRKAVETTCAMEKDNCRCLPEPARKVKDAASGLEAGLYDSSYELGSQRDRVNIALKAAVFGPGIISEEGEYSESVSDNYVADTEGLECCHSETSFDYGVETTIQDSDGRRYSAYYWDSSWKKSGLDALRCGQIALEKAQAKKGAVQVKSGRYRMLVENEVASKLVSPLLNALNAWSLQQNNSFLRDTLGKKCFSEKFQLRDIPRTPGLQGVRWYDSEGVATRNADIIRDGVVQQYFVSSYMARKTGLEPNIEMPNKVFLPPTIPGSSLDDLVSACPEGILITDFNGGNFNSSTGDFSYGIEGFLIRGGKLAKPIEGMVVTGNLVELWNHFEAAADDTRNCMSKLIPTLAFSYADFSGE